VDAEDDSMVAAASIPKERSGVVFVRMMMLLGTINDRNEI
jgi:hypothetical protein